MAQRIASLPQLLKKRDALEHPIGMKIVESRKRNGERMAIADRESDLGFHSPDHVCDVVDIDRDGASPSDGLAHATALAPAQIGEDENAKRRVLARLRWRRLSTDTERDVVEGNVSRHAP